MNKRTFRNFIRSKIVIGVVIALVVIIGGYFLFFRHSPTYQFVTVQRGSVIETVSLTGNTKPEQSVSLSFGSSGTISNVYSDLGKQVQAGQVLAELNMNDLVAGLHQAQANVDAQQAKLQGLQSGARPEDIALYKQKYADASSALVIAMNNTYLQTESAVLRYADTLFTNGTTVNPAIQVSTQSRDEEQSINMDRIIAGEKLKKWKTALTSISASSDDKSINDTRSIGTDAVNFISGFISHLGTIVGILNPNGSNLSQTVIDTYRTNINTAAQIVTSGASAEQTAYAAWTSADETLISQQAGSKSTDISAQVAAVKSAQAGVDSSLANIQNAEIVAPLSGTITQFDAKVGQLASPSTPLVSIMSDSGYEVDAGASEIDVGKIALGNKVSMTIDALPNETFPGSVFYIAPAQTNVQGVITYQIKISFDKPDPRFKSGFTVNIDIETRRKDNVLTLPQYAILQNDQGIFVETLENGVTKQNPVTLGIQDQKGNVEIVSGVTEGEKVLNIGLKAQ
jgi:RND family efflux transporter MFP subunit